MASSYWTRRRHIRSDVVRHIESITKSQCSDGEHDCNTIECEESEDVNNSIFDEEQDLDNLLLQPPLSQMCDTDQSMYIDRDELNHVNDVYTSDQSTTDEPMLAEDESTGTLADKLTQWALMFGVTLTALTCLLQILQPFHTSLPRDARTLLKTKRTSGVQSKAGGAYYYFGILQAFNNFMTERQEQILDGSCLDLQINVDGLPLFKSSAVQLWPILGMLQRFNEKQPQVIGVFCGSKKPMPLDEFLEDFVADINTLEKGFEFRGKQLRMKVSTIMCDAPAMAFLKKVKSHNGYYGCHKCIQSGEYLTNRMTFPETNSQLRTDLQFYEMSDEDHHLGESPLRRTSVGLVTQFPLDYMHLVCLGVMRRLLNLWLKGPLTTRLSSGLVRQLSANLVKLRCFLPVEFARKPRGVNELDRWKATEFRQLLLYTGSIVLRDILSTTVYKNFMLLSVAIFLLASPNVSEDYCDYAHELLVSFVHQFSENTGQLVQRQT